MSEALLALGVISIGIALAAALSAFVDDQQWVPGVVFILVILGCLLIEAGNRMAHLEEAIAAQSVEVKAND